jgi:hypothetical protein
MLVLTQSGKGLCAYVHASCGAGESTTDAVFGGASIIAERGKTLAESKDAKLLLVENSQTTTENTLRAELSAAQCEKVYALGEGNL